jgi:arsenate reductase (thioredoxin)
MPPKKPSPQPPPETAAAADPTESSAASQRRKVLFVCVGNTCRSQMAEALARREAADIIDPASAGISPFGRVVEPTKLVLLEKGIRIDGQFSKGLSDATLFRPDLVINMTGIPGASLFAQARYQDWDVEDPYGEHLETYRRICEDIEARVRELAATLREEAAQSPDR